MIGAKDAYTAMLVSIPDGAVKEIELPANEVNSRMMVVGYLRDGTTAFVMRGNGIQLINSQDGTLKDMIAYPDGFPSESTKIASNGGGTTIVEESTAMISGKLEEGESQQIFAWNFDEKSPH